jgi:hypothetical protein
MMTQSLRLVFIENEFLERSQSGAIWGSVHFEIGDQFFPDNGWTDLVSGFVTNWLDALTQIAQGKVTHQRVWFMDGPFAIDLSANNHDGLAMTFLHKEVQKYLLNANVKDLHRNGIDVGKQVIASCKQRGWTDKDVSDLSEAIKLSIEVSG